MIGDKGLFFPVGNTPRAELIIFVGYSDRPKVLGVDSAVDGVGKALAGSLDRRPRVVLLSQSLSKSKLGVNDSRLVGGYIGLVESSGGLTNALWAERPSLVENRFPENSLTADAGKRLNQS